MLLGCVFLFISLPGFVMVLFNADRGAGSLVLPLLVMLGGGVIIGAIFLIFGLRVIAFPGSWLYRITHGRLFSR
jgi:hypothetical protein